MNELNQKLKAIQVTRREYLKRKERASTPESVQLINEKIIILEDEEEKILNQLLK